MVSDRGGLNPTARRSYALLRLQAISSTTSQRKSKCWVRDRLDQGKGSASPTFFGARNARRRRYSCVYLISGVLLAFPSSASTLDQDVWKACSVDTVTICTRATCSSRKPDISIYLADRVDVTTEAASYYRCGVGLIHCDRYNALVYRSGEYVIFSLPQRSLFSKLGVDDGLTDVAAVGESVIISRGRCYTAAPPPANLLRSR